MKYSICLLIGFLIISCNVQNNAVIGIANLAKRSDCQGPCGKIMPCEGKSYTLEVFLNGSNVLLGGRTLFVRDPDNYDYTVKIEFPESVSADVYQPAKDGGYKKLKVTGMVEGYDVFVHETCTRSYIFKVKSANDFSLSK
ncbi:MAG: hypothetical protein ABI851_07475 [Saprospiraceae bacterium]